MIFNKIYIVVSLIREKMLQSALFISKNMRFCFISVIVAHICIISTCDNIPKTFKNYTSSVPIGKYREIKNQKIEKNTIVAFSSENIYFPFGSKPNYFLKYVSALEGDYLLLNDAGIYVNDIIIVNNPFSQTEYNLEHFNFDGIIPNGYAFVSTSHSSSYDSRYFGLIEITKLIPVEKIE